jgi:repressor LexA
MKSPSPFPQPSPETVRETMSVGQERVFLFALAFRHEKGYPPTRAEIASGLGFKSPNAAEEHLKALERKGWVRIHRGIARGLELVR